MRVSQTYAMAASVAALCVAAPTALYLLKPKTNSIAASSPKETVIAAVPMAPAQPVGRVEPARPDNVSGTGIAGSPAPTQPTAALPTPVAAPEPVAKQDELAKVATDAGRADKPATPAVSPPATTESNRLVDELKRKAETDRSTAMSVRERNSQLLAQATVQGEVRRPATVPAPGMAMAGAPLTAADARPVERKYRSSSANQMAFGALDTPNIAPEWGKSRLGGQIAVASPPPPSDSIARPHIDQGRDQFETSAPNPVKSVADEPVSTFSIDVDTASYSFVRRSLNGGRLPPKGAVRVEEMINYFPYDYARPESAAEPFRANVQVFPSPWNASNQLVHIGLKGYDLKSAERPRANLVFLVDISGSMGPEDRLPLLKNAFRMLLDNLRPNDTVSIVTYANGSDVRLQPTMVAAKSSILAAIDSLRAGGSTHGAQGITDAYKVAEANFDKAAVNRVILATDGDWNVGITNRDQLKGFIERKRETGIFLSILGVGMGNHNDALMQTLAQSGNGAAAYIDTLNEARKVLVDEASSTLFPIAKDVKIQLEFNPARVSEYRLIGYETRLLKREDFNNDKVDAGDVGSGHSVTAIYEITPVNAPKLADDLRYQPRPAAAPARPPVVDAKAAEIGFLKLRYKLPKEEASRLATFAIGPEQERRAVAEASTEARFSTAVAAFGQLLGGQAHMKGYTFDDVIALANSAKGEDPFGYRAEFVNLVRLAKTARASVAPR